MSQYFENKQINSNKYRTRIFRSQGVFYAINMGYEARYAITIGIGVPTFYTKQTQAASKTFRETWRTLMGVQLFLRYGWPR